MNGFVAFHFDVSASKHTDISISMQVDIAFGSDVYTVGGIHINCAFKAKFQPSLSVGMYDIEKVASVTHGNLVTF